MARPIAVHSRRVSLSNLALLACAVMLADCGPPAPPPNVNLSIESDGDFLTFKPDTLTAQSGAHVVLTFHHGGTIISQDHDWVLAKPGTMKALLAESDKMAATMKEDAASFLKPDDPRIIAATKLIKKGETATVEFTAPAPGDYPFFCSTPGHGDSMRGTLHVTT